MQNQPSQRSLYEQKYQTSRHNLLLIVVFTAINLLLLVTNADSYFLFSAFVPYYMTLMGMFLCGRFPAEYYAYEFEGQELQFYDNSVFVILLIVSIVITLSYLLAWFMSSKQRVGWLIFSLVFFTVDTVAMVYLNGISIDSIFDILFHAWVIYYLVLGISAHNKLKKLPPEDIVIPSESFTVEAATAAEAAPEEAAITTEAAAQEENEAPVTPDNTQTPNS